MRRATPWTRELSRRLIAFETMANRFSERKIPAAFCVCQQLRPYLASLMGRVGFRALLSRALAAASPDAPWLGMVKVKADGSLEAFDHDEAAVCPKEMAAGSLGLIAQLLALLVAFVGENLTLQMIEEVWPNLPFDDLIFSKDD
jgi:hypothetical protein